MIISPLYVLNNSKAMIRPANPVMDYVPQNTGIYDTYYENFKENDCRACHGSSTAERHHTTNYALIGNCSFCHSAMALPPIEEDSGWESGTKFSQVCSQGIHLWQNLSSVQNNDGTFSYCNIDDTDPTCYFDVKGFDFSSIPDNAEIRGIQVYIKGKVNEPNWRGWDNFVKLLKAGIPAGDNKATISRIWKENWKTQYYGGASDYWGIDWTLSDIKNPGFGLRFSFYNSEDETVRIEIDHVAIKIYYQLPQEKSDCKICHIDGGPIGDFGSPHHNSDLAFSGKCNECHPHVVEINTVPPPSYEPSSITPTPYSCENCHWPSGNKPHQASTYDGDTLNFLEDWQNWTVKPLPTTWPNGLAHPQPIEANGPVFSGTLGSRPYRPDDGTHHKVGGKVYEQCYFCHNSTPVNISNWGPSNPYLIRLCENCHSVDSLHNIEGHVTDGNIYRVNGIGNQTVTKDEKCIGCHGAFMPEYLSLPKDIPIIDYIEPSLGPPGITVNIYPASGVCFNEDPINGLCSFGQKLSSDEVIMGQQDSNGEVQWINVPVLSWSEHLIQIKIPEQTFEPGKTVIRVRKENLGTTNFKVFVLLHNPVINSLTPSSSSWGQDVLVSGDGFPLLKEKIYQNESRYGYSAYIELNSTNDRYRVTMYYRKDPMDPNKVFIKLTDLLNINTGNPVTKQDLYPGCWNLRVIVDYFKDNPADGILGRYNLGMGGLDLSDELLYRAVSNSLCLTIADNFSINELMIDNFSSKETSEIKEENLDSTYSLTYVIGESADALLEDKINQQEISEEELFSEIKDSLDYENNDFFSGLTVQDLTPELIQRFNLPDKYGVIILEISENSLASSVFMPEDIILKINQISITSVEDYNRAVDIIKSGDEITLLIFRNSSFLYTILSDK